MSASGPTIGILMLDTAFERFPGDVGHSDTWPFPVRFKTVPGATAAAATRLSDDSLLDVFVRAGLELVEEGVHGITTSCGFLALYQRTMAEQLPVPVATSALLQVPAVRAMLPPGRRVGVLTFDAATLGPDHLSAAGAPAETPLAGLPAASRFRADILGGAATSFAEREREVLDCARLLREESPDLGAIVLECTNFAPHAAALRAELKLPVYDIVTLVAWLHGALAAVPRLRG